MGHNRGVLPIFNKSDYMPANGNDGKTNGNDNPLFLLI